MPLNISDEIDEEIIPNWESNLCIHNISFNQQKIVHKTCLQRIIETK